MKTESKILWSDLEAQGETQCRVAFGQNGHYIAWSTYDGWKKCYPSASLGSVYERSRIEIACLGVDDAYFILQTDGKFWYDLRDNYDALEEVMNDLCNGDIEVSSIPVTLNIESAKLTPRSF